jgi:hypothetical protein
MMQVKKEKALESLVGNGKGLGGDEFKGLTIRGSIRELCI